MPTYSISKKHRQAWNLVFEGKRDWHESRRKWVDFSYGYDTKKALIRPFERSLKYFHDKYHFFRILTNFGVNCIPRTYLSINKFLENRKDDNSLWFCKLSTFDCGSGVTPFFDKTQSIKSIKRIAKICDDDEEDYIIQRGVPDLMLYDNHKFDIRIHILVTTKGDVYVYKNACMRISYKTFDPTCDCKRHQLTNGSLGADVQYTDKWSKWETVYPSIQRSIIEIINAMKRYMEDDKYLLIGADFIIDNNNKAWVLEFNTYPNLFYEPDPHMQPTITHMLSNMLDILTHGRCHQSDIYNWEYLTNIH